MTLDLTDEERAVLRIASRPNPKNVWGVVCLRSAILKTQAGKMRAEFEVEHYECRIIDGQMLTQAGPCIDPRHNWKDEQWLEAANDWFSREGKG